MEQAFEQLQKLNKTDMESIVKWMKDSKLINTAAAESRARELFLDGITNPQNIDANKIMEVLKSVAGDNLKKIGNVGESLLNYFNKPSGNSVPSTVVQNSVKPESVSGTVDQQTVHANGSEQNEGSEQSERFGQHEGSGQSEGSGQYEGSGQSEGSGQYEDTQQSEESGQYEDTQQSEESGQYEDTQQSEGSG